MNPEPLKKEMSPDKNVLILNTILNHRLLQSLLCQKAIFPVEKFALIRKSKYGQCFCSGLRHTSEAYTALVVRLSAHSKKSRGNSNHLP